MGSTIYLYIYESISVAMVMLAYFRIYNKREIVKLFIFNFIICGYGHIFMQQDNPIIAQMGVSIYIIAPLVMAKVFDRSFKYSFAVIIFLNLFLLTGENIGFTFITMIGLKLDFIAISILYLIVFLWSLLLIRYREFITNLFEYFISKKESKLTIIYLMIVQVLIKYYKIFYFREFYYSFNATDAIFLSQIVVVCFIVYLYRNSYIKRELERNRLLVEKAERELVENRAKSHEYKNHYACLIGLCNIGNKEDIKSYIGDI